MPGANESSTVEWHSAHWIPIERRVPCELKNPSRPTLPSASACLTAAGSASESTLSPTASAVLGLTPGPTPPRLAPSTALCRPRVSPQNAWSPKVSKRKTSRPWLVSLRASPVADGVASCIWRCACAESPHSLNSTPTASRRNTNRPAVSAQRLPACPLAGGPTCVSGIAHHPPLPG